jgi:hypothetical protein
MLRNSRAVTTDAAAALRQRRTVLAKASVSFVEVRRIRGQEFVGDGPALSSKDNEIRAIVSNAAEATEAILMADGSMSCVAMAISRQTSVTVGSNAVMPKVETAFRFIVVHEQAPSGYE